MAKTYDVSKLQPINPLDRECALAWVRLWLRDKPDSEGNYSDRVLEDAEYYALLKADAPADYAVLPLPLVYYRPHVTAALILRSDPERAESVSYDGLSKTKRSVDALVDAILEAGAAFDRLIPLYLLANADSAGGVLVLGL